MDGDSEATTATKERDSVTDKSRKLAEEAEERERNRLRSESETERKSEVPASPRDEALIHCAEPSSLAVGPLSQEADGAKQGGLSWLHDPSGCSWSCWEAHFVSCLETDIGCWLGPSSHRASSGFI